MTFARTLGLVPWTLDGRSDPKAVRDRTLLHLLYDLALRRAKVVGLDRADLDLAAGTLQVLGKGRTARLTLTLPAPTKAALGSWIELRGDVPGRSSRRSPGRRTTAGSRQAGCTGW